MTRHEVIEAQIEEIMDELDFHAIHCMFQANSWGYGADGALPSVGELRKTARSLLRSVSQYPTSGTISVESGRFQATLIENADEKWLRLTLHFTPTSWGIDEGQEYTD